MHVVLHRTVAGFAAHSPLGHRRAEGVRRRLAILAIARVMAGPTHGVSGHPPPAPLPPLTRLPVFTAIHVEPCVGSGIPRRFPRPGAPGRPAPIAPPGRDAKPPTRRAPARDTQWTQMNTCDSTLMLPGAPRPMEVATLWALCGRCVGVCPLLLPQIGCKTSESMILQRHYRACGDDFALDQDLLYSAGGNTMKVRTQVKAGKGSQGGTP